MIPSKLNPVIKRIIYSIFFCLTITVGAQSHYNIKDYGAVGDGKSLDSDAINNAISDASKNGGGTIYFPPGIYLSYSIRLKNNIHLYLSQGAILKAAGKNDNGSYDLPGVGAGNEYQDFGHSYWHNSLIWGENLKNVSITGFGLIDGENLSRGFYEKEHWEKKGIPAGNLMWEGGGNKTIALKLCRNVILKDFSILKGGHFGILATGVDNFTIDNLKIDTNRDGMDIDACKNVSISNCKVNSPNDDAICLKSSYALGFTRATENVTITNCQVSGYDVGSMLDGTFRKEEGHLVPDQEGPTGRIKFGTESNGGFKNIAITNCIFDHCRGLALETVDGGVLEDVVVNNITMRDLTNSPLFLRLGERMRGPKSLDVGELRRVTISNINVYEADSHFSTIISGTANRKIKNVKISDMNIWYKPIDSLKSSIQKVVPEHLRDYPEPAKFGLIPSYAFFVRHASNIEIQDVNVYYLEDESRTAMIFDDVNNLELEDVDVQKSNSLNPFILFNNILGLKIKDSDNLKDQDLRKIIDRLEIN